jgi:Ca2+-binding RTX toxin-like protein
MRLAIASSARALTLTGLTAGCLLLLGLVPAAEARTSCAYSGPPENLLTVTSDGNLAEIARRGQRILVREYLERPKRCSGGVPTVLNTDTIRVQLTGGFADLFLAGGPFAPGATPETEGASEIEVEFAGPDILATVNGTALADVWQWGPGLERHAGLNLNAGTAGDQDVDVTIRGSFAGLMANGRGGNDSIVPAPGAGFPNDGVFSVGGSGDDRLEATHNGGGLIEGGPGDDVLLGGRRGDDLEAGGGNDTIRGAGGGDRIIGGPGRDLIRGGPGRDNIESRDAKRDNVRCGPGRDRVKADPRDRLRGCELVRRR